MKQLGILLGRLGTRWLLGLVLAGFLCQQAAAQVPNKQWERLYGTGNSDEFRSMHPTSDGGYILAGYTEAGIAGDKSQPSWGRADYWLIKVDALGQKQWERSYGGDREDRLQVVQQTADGGYILGGTSDSGVSGDKTVPPQPGATWLVSSDYWLLKLDASGVKEWDQVVGGNDTDVLQCLQQTADGGYLLGGYSFSEASGDKTEASHGSSDWWVVKLDQRGRKQWDRTLGGDDGESLGAVQQTADGGYLLGGTSGSGISADHTQPARGSNDFWVVRLDAQGRKQWDRTYGGMWSDVLLSLQQTAEGGFILGGWSQSGISGEKTQGSYGDSDYWLVKITATGTLQWDRTYGGSGTDELTVVRQTADQGYIFGGRSTSGVSFDKSQPSRGRNFGYDGWVLKVDATGRKQWDRTYGGEGDEYLSSLLATADGGYLLGGTFDSGPAGENLPGSHRFDDYWLVKLQLGAAASAPPVQISGDSLLCATHTLTLTASANTTPLAYRWNTGATTASIQVTQPGDYSVQATFLDNVTSTAHYQVRILAAPILAPFTLGTDTTLCADSHLVLRAPAGLGPSVTYHWSDGSTGLTLPVHQTGTYSLEIRTTCESRTATRQVTVGPCLPTVVIPNVITPNGDGQNEYFVLIGLGSQPWELALYTRWGSPVYQTSHYQNEWGHEALAGGYYYLLRQPTTGQTYKGWVEVIR